MTIRYILFLLSFLSAIILSPTSHSSLSQHFAERWEHYNNSRHIWSDGGIQSLSYCRKGRLENLCYAELTIKGEVRCIEASVWNVWYPLQMDQWSWFPCWYVEGIPV